MARCISSSLVFLLLLQSTLSMLSRHLEGCTTVPDMCYKLISDNYTHMRLPNMLNHTRKEDVSGDLSLWSPLLQSKECNAGNQLKYFLCFTYAPVCVDNKSINKFIPPCKSMCRSVRQSCEPVMQKHNYSWPVLFNCDHTHRFFDDETQMCISMKILAGIHNTKKTSHTGKRCSCKKEYKTNRLKSLICRSHFVIKARFMSKPALKSGSNNLEIETKASRMLSLSKTNRRGIIPTGVPLKMVLFNDRNNCHCNRLQTRKRARGYYFVIGRKHRNTLQVDAIAKWKDVPNALKKPRQC